MTVKLLYNGGKTMNYINTDAVVRCNCPSVACLQDDRYPP